MAAWLVRPAGETHSRSQRSCVANTVIRAISVADSQQRVRRRVEAQLQLHEQTTLSKGLKRALLSTITSDGNPAHSHLTIELFADKHLLADNGNPSANFNAENEVVCRFILEWIVMETSRGAISVVALLTLLLFAACLGCGVSHPPVPTLSEPVGPPYWQVASWTASPDPTTETARSTFSNSWQTQVPNRSDIYLPSIAGPTAVTWDSSSQQATSIDLRDGQPQGVVSISIDSSPSIRSVDVSSDGKFLAAADVNRSTPAVHLWSFESNTKSSLTLDDPETGVVRFLPGHRLLVARWGLPDMGKIDVSIWNAATANRMSGFTVEKGPNFRLQSGGVAISPSGKYGVFVCGMNVFVYDLTTGESAGRVDLDARVHITSHLCQGIAFSPDSKQLAVLLQTNLTTELFRLDFASGAVLGQVTVPIELANLKRQFFANCPDLQWTPSGWLLYGQTFTNGVDIEVPAGGVNPHQHWLNEQLALTLDPTHQDQRTDTLAVATPQPTVASPPAIAPTEPSPTVAIVPPVSPPAPQQIAWSAVPDPDTNTFDIADDLGVELPYRVGHIQFTSLRSPFVTVSRWRHQSLYDLRTQKLVGEITPIDQYHSPVLSPSGKFLLNFDSGFFLWSFDAIPSRRVTDRVFPNFTAFASDDVLVTGGDRLSSREYRLRTWDLLRGGLQHDIKARTVLKQSVALSPGGRYLVFVDSASGLDPKLNVCDIASGEVIGQADIPPRPDHSQLKACFGMAFSTDGTKLAAAWNYRSSATIRFSRWDFSAGKLTHDADIGVAEDLGRGLRLDDLLPSESLMWDSADGGWILFQRVVLDDTGRIVGTLPTTPVDRSYKQLVDRNRMLVLLRDKKTEYGLLTVLNLSNNIDSQLGSAIAMIPKPAPKPDPAEIAAATRAKEMSIETERAASVAASPPPVREKTPKHAWSIKPDPPAEPLITKAPPTKIRGAFQAKFIYPNRTSPFVGILEEKEGRCRLADLRTGEDVATISAEFRVSWPINISPDGKYLAVLNDGDNDVVASVWSFETGKKCAEVDDSHFAIAKRYYFAAPAQLLVTDDDLDATLIVATNLETNELSWKTKIPRHGAYGDVDISPGGKYVAVGAGRLLYILDAATGNKLETLTLPIPWDRNQPVVSNGVRFSPDSSMLIATCNMNRMLAGWDMATGERVLNRSYPHSVVVGDSSNESIIKWLPDSSGWLLADSALVEATTGAPVWTFPRPASDLKLLSLNSVLTTESSGRDGETRIVETRMPGSEFRKAFAAARAAPSEIVPKSRPIDLSAMTEISQPEDVVTWHYERDEMTSTTGTPKLSISDVRPAAFRLATADVNHAVLQNTSDSDRALAPPPGPRRPMRRSMLTIFDAIADKPLGEIETTGGSEMLDVSPDGSLVLMGSSWRQGGPYNRLDIWAPMLKKHVVGWDPVITDSEVMENHIYRAFYVDKPHVLTVSRSEIVLWDLRSSTAVYRLKGTGEVVAFSPTRKYFVHHRDFSDMLIHEALTGRCVGRLEKPSSNLGTSTVCWFRPDGLELVMIGGGGLYTTVAIHDLTSGQIRSEFGIPTVYLEDGEWITSRYLFLHEYPRSRGKKYLLDLENRALVTQYSEGSIRNVGSLDGKVWRTVPEPGRAATTLEVRELSFPLPADGPRLEDHAYLYPGGRVALSVTSSTIDRAQIEQELSAKLKEVGLKVTGSAPSQLRLELVGTDFSPRKLKDGRTLSLRSFTLKWACFVSGRKVWEQTKRVPDGVINVSRTEAQADKIAREKLRAQIRETVGFLTIPRYLFPDVEELKIPQGSL